jgi:hypothetical protein
LPSVSFPLNLAGDKDNQDQQSRTDLGCQGQAERYAQGHLPPAPAAAGNVSGQVQSEQHKKGQQGLGGVEMGQLDMEDGQANKQRGYQASPAARRRLTIGVGFPCRDFGPQAADQAVGEIHRSKVKEGRQGPAGQV